VVDVTGPAATSSPPDVTSDDADLLPADDVTFVHVSDVRSLLTSAEPESAGDVNPVLPVVVYVRSNDTEAGRVVLQLMPSVQSLRGNEACRLRSRDALIRQTFDVQQKHAVSSLVFTRAVHASRRRYQLSIICQPVLVPVPMLGSGSASVPPFTVYLHVQLL